MTTAKEVITKQRDLYAKLVQEDDENFKIIMPTYGQALDQNTRIAWERALSWVLVIIDEEEKGTLDATLAVISLKSKS